MSDDVTQEAPADELTADRFRTQLEKTFTLVGDGDETLDVELVEVGELRGDTTRKDRTPFSLLFRGPKGAVIEQRIHHLTNDTMGELDVFLVCVGPDPDDGMMRYEAVFS